MGVAIAATRCRQPPPLTHTHTLSLSLSSHLSRLLQGLGISLAEPCCELGSVWSRAVPLQEEDACVQRERERVRRRNVSAKGPLKAPLQSVAIADYRAVGSYRPLCFDVKREQWSEF